MKTKIKLVVLIMISLFFTSCIDIFHAVSLNKGMAKVTVRYEIQKGMLDAIGSLSGEDSDYSELTDMGDDIFGDFNAIEAEYRNINTSYHLGAEVNFKGKVDDLVSELDENLFLPIKTDRGYEISVPGLKEGEESDEMTMAFLSGSKYTLLLDLSGDLKNIKTAVLKPTAVSQSTHWSDDIPVNIYGSSMLIEIPITVLFMTEKKLTIELLE